MEKVCIYFSFFDKSHCIIDLKIKNYYLKIIHDRYVCVFVYGRSVFKMSPKMTSLDDI